MKDKSNKKTVNFSNKKVNPLYVVTNNGKDVQAAYGAWDALVKKLGVGPFFTFLNSAINNLWRFLWSQVHDYVNFLVIKQFWDEFLTRLERFIKRLDPLLAYTLFQS